MKKLILSLCGTILTVCGASALDWSTDDGWKKHLTAFEQLPVQKLTPVDPNYKHISYALTEKPVYASEEQALRDRFLPEKKQSADKISSAEFVMDLSKGIFFAFRYTGIPGDVVILAEREIPGCTLNIRFSERNASPSGAVRHAVSKDDNFSYAAFFIPWNSFYFTNGTYPLILKNNTKWKITVTRRTAGQSPSVWKSDSVVVKPVSDRKLSEEELKAFEETVQKNIGEGNLLGSLDGTRGRIELMKYWHETFRIPIRVIFTRDIATRSVTLDMVEKYQDHVKKLVQNMRAAQNNPLLFRYYYGYPFNVVRANWTYHGYMTKYFAIRDRVFSEDFGVEKIPEVESQEERIKAVEETRTDSVW